MNIELNLIREASRLSLVTFLERAMPLLIPGYVAFAYISLIAAMIEEPIIAGHSKRLVVNLPPRHGKSFILVAVAAWYLGRFPKREVLFMTHSQSLANDLSAKLGQLLETTLFKETFPNFAFAEGRESRADFRTSKGGAFKAAGFETRITGRGADLLLIDDSISAQDATSSAIRNFTKNTYDDTVSTRFNNRKLSVTVSLSHRLHEDDLPAHLIKLGFDHLKLAYKATADESYQCSGITFERKRGEILQPGFSPLDQADLKVSDRVYATQYQQEPTSVGSGEIKQEHFAFVTSCPSGGETIMSWDIASSIHEGRSYSVALVFQVIGGVAYLKHIFRDRLEYIQLRDHAIHLEKTFRPTRHLVEYASLGAALASDLKTHGANVITINPTSSKEDRLSSVINQIVANAVRPVAGIANIQAFLNECTSFPNGVYDDMVDALSQFLNWWRDNPLSPPRQLVTMLAGGGLKARIYSPRTAEGRVRPRRSRY